MGIDIYAEWDGVSFHDRMDKEIGKPDDLERGSDEMATYFDVAYSGERGYLRESYHGSPYATREFVREAFESADARAEIPASVLMGRLEKAAADTIKRYQDLYDCDPMSEETREQMRQFSDFARLVERVERETSKPVTIVASY